MSNKETRKDKSDRVKVAVLGHLQTEGPLTAAQIKNLVDEGIDDAATRASFWKNFWYRMKVSGILKYDGSKYSLPENAPATAKTTTETKLKAPKPATSDSTPPAESLQEEQRKEEPTADTAFSELVNRITGDMGAPDFDDVATADLASSSIHIKLDIELDMTDIVEMGHSKFQQVTQSLYILMNCKTRVRGVPETLAAEEDDELT